MQESGRVSSPILGLGWVLQVMQCSLSAVVFEEMNNRRPSIAKPAIDLISGQPGSTDIFPLSRCKSPQMHTQ